MDLLIVNSTSESPCENETTHGKTYKGKDGEFYNQVIQNGVKERKRIKRHQTSLDGLHPIKRNRNLYINEPRSEKCNNRNLSIHYLEIKSDDSNLITCSKNVIKSEQGPKSMYPKSYKTRDISQVVAPKSAEKTTYCRPVTEMYNQEFIYKTIQRNARLQGLVRRLVLAREREKQKVSWNNYVNDLRNNHGYYNPEPRTMHNCMPEDRTAEFIEDYYNTRFKWKQSNPCQHLLQDIYGAEATETYHDNYRIQPGLSVMDNPLYNYDNNRYCFPTSSQGRIIMQRRERQSHQLPYPLFNRPENKHYHSNTITVGKDSFQDISKRNYNRSNAKRNLTLNTKPLVKSLTIQTDLDSLNASTKNSPEETFQTRYEKVSTNVERLKQKIMHADNEVKYGTLASIENKLDALVESINALIVETKSKRIPETKSEALSYDFNNTSPTKSDTFGMIRQEHIVCGIVQESPKSSITFKEGKRHETIEEIFYDKANRDSIKKNIEGTLKPNNCVKLTFDIPTKEIATEITNSLYKNISKGALVTEVDKTRMTIAVNTDPLGLLALFRVSAETVKQILSYMPQIDYYSYLSRLSLPLIQPCQQHGGSSFVCNICGAAFSRPSQLSDHIQQHNLGNSRDCCVCRHSLDMLRHRSGLFPCRHCGQQFTRAYCRQLHEQTCRLANSLNDTPSLILLK